MHINVVTMGDMFFK